LAYRSLSSGNTPTVFDSFVSQGLANVFSMCFTNYGGTFTLGGINSKYYIGAIKYTPIVNELYYSVQLSQIKANNVIVNYPALSLLDVIVDSGTSYLLIPNTLFMSIQTAMQAAVCNVTNPPDCFCGSSTNVFSGKCLPVSIWDLNRYPTLNFTFPATTVGPAVTVTLKPTQYMMSSLSSFGTCYCMTIQSIANNSRMVLGDTFLSGSLVVFDRANAQIGFAQANLTNCENTLAPLPPPSGNPYYPTEPHVPTYVFVLLLLLGIVVVGFLAGIGAILAYRSYRNQDDDYMPLTTTSL